MVRRGPRALLAALTATHPDLELPQRAIEEGRVEVDGMVVRNPRSMVGPGSTVRVQQPVVLRGEAKLGAALDGFDVSCTGRVALDVGAAAGGFTRVLLERGARRVYAVDAGHGQLLGSLRQDARVVNLEATNLGALHPGIVPEAIDLFTLDLSYLSLTDAASQLDLVAISPNAELIAIVKPMFELHLPQPPDDLPSREDALRRGIDGIEAAGWTVRAWMESPVQGSRGAFEYLVHASREEPDGVKIRETGGNE